MNDGDTSAAATTGSEPSAGTGQNRVTIEPHAKHVAADRIGKTLGNMAGSINKALEADDDPIVVNRKERRHVSFQGLEELIDRALEA